MTRAADTMDNGEGDMDWHLLTR